METENKKVFEPRVKVVGDRETLDNYMHQLQSETTICYHYFHNGKPEVFPCIIYTECLEKEGKHFFNHSSHFHGKKIDETSKKDRLQQIVELQKSIMKRFYDVDRLTMEQKCQETLRFLTAVQCEVVEILHEDGGIVKYWKNWKKSAKEPDTEYVLRELIDILHFTLEMLILWGATPEKIYDVYVDKNKENHARYDGKY
jgi:hypothetical protein